MKNLRINFTGSCTFGSTYLSNQVYLHATKIPAHLNQLTRPCSSLFYQINKSNTNKQAWILIRGGGSRDGILYKFLRSYSNCETIETVIIIHKVCSYYCECVILSSVWIEAAFNYKPNELKWQPPLSQRHIFALNLLLFWKYEHHVVNAYANVRH